MGGGMRGKNTVSQFLSVLFWRQRQIWGKSKLLPLLHATCHVKALMQCCSHQCYFRPTNSSAFQCMVTVIFKFKRHFLLPITAQQEAVLNPQQLAAPLHVYSPQLSLAGSATRPLERFEFCLAPFSFWGAGSDLPLPPTNVHNIPVLVETISWLGHTKAAALFGNKLFKRSWEQPQTAALQQNLKHSLRLPFLSATSTRKEAFWGNPLRLGRDRLTHWVNNHSTVWSVTQGQNGA